MSLKSIFIKNRVFLYGYFLLVLIAIYILIFYSKADGFYLMNPYHSDFLNKFFIWFTYLGHGLLVIALCIILFLFKKKFLSLMILSSYALSGIIAQGLKYFISEARPAYFLEKANYPYFINHVTLHNYHSFPSGHTASAFALATMLSFSLNNKNYSIGFLFIAALVGYSRMYLGQHFIDDVFAGSFIGLLSSIFCLMYFENYFKKILKLKMS